EDLAESGIKPKSEREIESIAQDAMKDAVDFIESEISDDRIKAQRYYDGEVDIGYEDGRSKVVATKVRDTVRAVKPSLMRIFLSTAKPVEYTPKGPEDVAAAEQATSFMHHEFTRLNGYRVLNDAFHDALVKKQGIVKAYWLMTPHAEIYTFSDLSDDEYTYLLDDDSVSVLEHTVEYSMSIDPMGMEVEMPVHSVKISRQEDKGEMRIDSVPPEEFFINRDARNLEDAYIVAHRTEMRAGDLIAMGFDPEKVTELDSFDSGSEMTEAEVFERRGYEEDFSDEDTQDPAMRNVTVTEAYMRIDADGTGVPVLHKITLGGTAYEMLDYEPCDEIPFAKFEVDPEPHAFYGRSLAEIIIDDQDAATSILRGILDNVAMTNNPRVAAVEGQVNMDDLLNNEIGAVVRMRQPGAVQELTVPFVAGQTLGALGYLDSLVETKTGVTRASMGLDPDAMQSTTKAAVQATVQAAAGQVEVMVRNLADGLRDLFGIMLRLYSKNVDEEQMMRLNGSFIPVDPRVWDGSMDISINVGLGTGREEEKLMGLQQALQMQTMVYQNYGPMNGLVSLTNIRNTLADMLAVTGVRNADRYFAPITPEIEAQMLQMQQQAQSAQGQASDPNAAFLQAEQIKAQTKMQTDMAKLQLDAQKAASEDDLKRDKMAQDLLVDAAKIYGQYGTAVDVARVQAEQDKIRMIGGMAQGNAQ
uniref:portal protein n=1 Tax=Lentibacter algarum TaxID=576131 RepID=UPI0026F2ED97